MRDIAISNYTSGESGVTDAAKSLIADVKASATRLEEASW